jgi:hypothetical protein
LIGRRLTAPVPRATAGGTGWTGLAAAGGRLGGADLAEAIACAAVAVLGAGLAILRAAEQRGADAVGALVRTALAILLTGLAVVGAGLSRFVAGTVFGDAATVARLFPRWTALAVAGRIVGGGVFDGRGGLLGMGMLLGVRVGRVARGSRGLLQRAGESAAEEFRQRGAARGRTGERPDEAIEARRVHRSLPQGFGVVAGDPPTFAVDYRSVKQLGHRRSDVIPRLVPRGGTTGTVPTRVCSRPYRKKEGLCDADGRVLRISDLYPARRGEFFLRKTLICTAAQP